MIRHSDTENTEKIIILNVLISETQYNAAITEFVTGLSQAKQISDEKLSDWEEEFKEKERAVRLSIRKLQYLDWEIQNFIQFAPNKGENVKNKQKQLFDLVANLCRTQQGSLEEIRKI